MGGRRGERRMGERRGEEGNSEDGGRRNRPAREWLVKLRSLQDNNIMMFGNLLKQIHEQ